MKMILVKPLSAVLILFCSQLSFAGDHRSGKSHYDYARVTDVRPVYESVERRIPERDCWVETVAEHRPAYQSATGTILGGVIGAAVGNRLGHSKRNKQVGAVAGAVLGASIGRDISHRRSDREDVSYRDVERCETRYRQVVDQRLLGYDVSYNYRGRSYHTFMDEHPGKRVRIAVSVHPVRH